MVSTADVLDAISHDKSLILFNTIALSNSDGSDILISKLKLTRKQYYSRISKLVKVDLVVRRNGKYFLTSLGKIVYDAQKMIGNAIGDYWKLKAVDTLEITDQLPKEEYNKIINALIENEQIKEGLIIKSYPVAH
jgi:predicted transcriptional regulator